MYLYLYLYLYLYERICICMSVFETRLTSEQIKFYRRCLRILFSAPIQELHKSYYYFTALLRQWSFKTQIWNKRNCLNLEKSGKTNDLVTMKLIHYFCRATSPRSNNYGPENKRAEISLFLFLGSGVLICLLESTSGCLSRQCEALEGCLEATL